MSSSGFTLLELLVVMGVLAILFGIGIVNFVGLRNRAQVDQALVEITGAFTRAEAHVRRTSGIAYIKINTSARTVIVENAAGTVLSTSALPVDSLTVTCRMTACPGSSITVTLVAPGGQLTDDMRFAVSRGSKSRTVRISGPNAMAVLQ